MGKSLRHWERRTGYRRYIDFDLMHGDDGVGERQEAIGALRHYGPAGVPKLREFLRRKNCCPGPQNDYDGGPHLHQATALHSLEYIGPDAVSAGPDLLSYIDRHMMTPHRFKVVQALEALRKTEARAQAPDLIQLYIQFEEDPAAPELPSVAYRRLCFVRTITALASPDEGRVLLPILRSIAAEPETQDNRGVKQFAGRYIETLEPSEETDDGTPR